ncbi:restriction endonuclease subunit S [Nocardia tengchongensis]|uniref:restriction endonuclease subunit S n=1 Tax=Nocardia tengchongensis TaxID=2055889 RepID=UPI003685503B
MGAEPWQRVRLFDVGDWFSGGTPSTSNGTYWNGDIPWISAASMRSFSIEKSDRRLTATGAASGSRIIPPGSILFVVRGMSLNKEFRVGVTRREVAFGQDCKAIIPHDWIDSEFLANALLAHAPRILELVETTSHGTGRLDTERLGRLAIGVPDLALQRRIVEVVTSFDYEIEALEGQIGKLGEVESGLVSMAFVDAGSPRLALGDLAEVSAGVTLGSEAAGAASVELPYLRVANVLDGAIDTSDLKSVKIFRAQLDRYSLLSGDVLLTEGGDIDKLGRGAVWDGRVDPCLHQNHIFRVRCSPDLIPEYLSLYTASYEGRNYFMRVGKQSTNLASINSTQVRSMPIPVPTVDEQWRMLGPILAARKYRSTLIAQVAKLRTIRKAVAEDLLTGRVAVGDL